VVFGNSLSWRIVVAAVLACTGIGLMSWDGGANLVADAATVAGALGYALYVIVLSARAARHDARSLAATQIVWMAVLGGLWMLADALGTDRLQTLGRRLNAEILWGLAYLGVVATAAMLFLQARAQRHVSADKAALIYAMEPVFAALFAWAWLSEGLSLRAALGAGVVVFAVVFSEWKSALR
jgi:drug/metabolite transporter (DMT)-like permease